MRMRVVVFAILMHATGCSYDNPSYDGTEFICSASEPCPEGLTCINGHCGTPPLSELGVECGSAGQCAPGEMCCALTIGGPRCIPADMTCNGTSALCDGPEDCSAAQQCCGNSDVSCGDSCSPLACNDDSDCGGAAPRCCFLTPNPWGLCSIC